MHELSIAHGVVDLVRAHVPPARVADVRCVRLRVGDLAGVAASPLVSCFDLLVAGTALSSARLHVERLPLRVRCRTCGRETAPSPPRFRCPGCGSADVETLSGEELDVAEVVLAEEEAP